jgi:hypothetical protein
MRGRGHRELGDLTHGVFVHRVNAGDDQRVGLCSSTENLCGSAKLAEDGWPAPVEGREVVGGDPGDGAEVGLLGDLPAGQ